MDETSMIANNQDKTFDVVAFLQQNKNKLLTVYLCLPTRLARHNTISTKSYKGRQYDEKWQFRSSILSI